MDVLNQYLADRDQAANWQWSEQPAEIRLIKFDTWSRAQLAARLDWSWAGPDKSRRIEQARIYLERLVLDLWKRGWMLDGKRLADRITTMLDAVGSYQRAGKVRDFWPYYTATVRRYVGLNSEELQGEAMRAGASVGQAMAAILKLSGAQRGASLPELIAQRAQEVEDAKAGSLRERTARARELNAACRANARQPQLPL